MTIGAVVVVVEMVGKMRGGIQVIQRVVINGVKKKGDPGNFEHFHIFIHRENGQVIRSLTNPSNLPTSQSNIPQRENKRNYLTLLVTILFRF